MHLGSRVGSDRLLPALQDGLHLASGIEDISATQLHRVWEGTQLVLEFDAHPLSDANDLSPPRMALPKVPEGSAISTACTRCDGAVGRPVTGRPNSSPADGRTASSILTTRIPDGQRLRSSMKDICAT